MSVSFKKATNKTNIKHNNRDFTEKQKAQNSHIDFSKSDENKILVQKDLRELYEREFSEPLKNYNDKQKRNDRKIDDYYQHIKDSKKTSLQQEMIIQVGDKDDFNSPEDFERANEVLEDWFSDFEERNPNLKVYNAIIHNDEASPHLHLNFVPVADGYKRGLEKQVSFDRAIKQQDQTLNKTRPFQDWREKEVDLIAELLEERGIERKLVGTNEYKDVNEYKEKKDLEREIENKRLERDRVQEEVKNLEVTKSSLEDEIEPLRDDLKQLETIKRDKFVEQTELDNIRSRRKFLRKTEIEEEKAYKEKMKQFRKREKEAKQQTIEAESRLQKVELFVENELERFSSRLNQGIADLKEQANEIYQDFYSSAEDTLAIVKSYFKRYEIDFEETIEEEIDNQIEDAQEPNLNNFDYFQRDDDYEL